jgi:hypothetical protein
MLLSRKPLPLQPKRPMPTRVARHARPFATVAALAAATVIALLVSTPASAQAAVHYVALGDSYSSGVGAGSYISSSGSCDRSTKAYSQLWANANDPASYVSVACSGATTSTVISGQLSARQLDHADLDHCRRQRCRLQLRDGDLRAGVHQLLQERSTPRRPRWPRRCPAH